MKERPIIFSTPMVRAILDGRKTQTRRVVKIERWMVEQGVTFDGATVDRGFYGPNEEYLKVIRAMDDTRYRIVCPYGAPGSRLWVRETYAIDYEVGEGTRGEVPPAVFYKATDEKTNWTDGKTPWKPSIHMPRWASRISLEIVSVEVERLHDITILEARAEGITEYGEGFGFNGDDIWRNRTSVENFQWLWESINGPGSWDANPWVWVIEFKRVEK